MKNLYKCLLVAAILTTPAFVACEDDNDDNPIMKVPTTFVLNTPVNADVVYDLQNSEYVALTTAQPDYGYTAPVTYSVYMKAFGADFKELPGSYTTTRIQIPAARVNEALLDMAGDADLSAPVAATFKLSANITGYTGSDMTIESNEISINKLLCYVPEVTISLPEKIFMVGDFPASQWGTFLPLNPVYGKDGQFYAITYIENGKNFRFSLDDGWKGHYVGWSNSTRQGSAGEALVDANNDDNMTFQSPSGLYSVMMVAKIANGAIQYTFTMEPAQLYVFGACGNAADNWGWADENKFKDNGDGTAEVALGGAGELRMAVNVGTDWWRTEFTIMNTDATLFYRNVDIPNNWAENIGADYSFAGAAGKKIVLDFNTSPATGKME